jgi:hypothetical protein
MYKRKRMQSILEIVPSHELARTWPSRKTILMRMTSKRFREAIDKAKLPIIATLIWPKYRNNITEINNIFISLNITNLKITYFDFESDFNFECDEDNNQYEKVVKIVEEVEYDESIEYNESIEYEEDKLLILSDMFSLNKGLTELNLEDSELKNNSLKFFKEAFPKLQNLSKLNLKCNNFSCSLEFIEVLMMLPKLVCLNLDFNENFNEKGNMYSKNIQLLSDQILHLEELSLNGCYITHGSYDILKFIEICPGLVRLNLENNGLNDEWIKKLSEALSQCSNLAYLNLSSYCISSQENGNCISAEGTIYIRDLLNNHKLVSLELLSHKFGDKGLSNIANVLCSNLTNLNLANNMIGEEGATNIANALRDAQFPNLTNLCLKCNMIEDIGASNIINTKWSSLTCLDLSYNEIIERKKLKVLQLQCPSLKKLIINL